MRCLRLFPVVTLLWSAAAGSVAPGEFDKDGWYTWRVVAVDDAPQWCCLRWRGGTPRPEACRLDDRGFSFSNNDSAAAGAGELQVYALVQGGKAVRIRPLSPSCPVESRDPVVDLGLVDVEASLEWLKPYARLGDDDDIDALPAVALHRGAAALDFLADLVRHGDDPKVREEAVFWLGQVRIAEGKDTIVDLMFEDDDVDMRKHAAFSLAESAAPDKAALLIRQEREDATAEVRPEAWFWLAETGAAEAEAAIFEALGNDRSGEVREEAVFGLSQLPERRALDSLLAIVRDRSLDRELREEALFWLAESDSDEAFEAIDRLLSTR